MPTIFIASRTRRSQAGQSAIVFALAAIAAFAFVGLVLDGSNIYRWRRYMQNCADASALAGARIAVDSSRTNGQVYSTLVTYARNNAKYTTLEAYYVSESARLGAVSSYSPGDPIPASATGLHIIARKDVPVLFGFALGSRLKKAAAQAMAVFGPCQCAQADASIIPVAIEDDILTDISAGDIIEIWDSNKVVDEDGNDLGGNRGWLNLDYIYSNDDPDSRTTSKNHSNAKLKNWAQYGMNPAVTIFVGSVGGLDGDFINGDPGVRASAIQKLGTRVGDTVLIPIFDTAYTKASMSGSSSLTTPGIGWANNSYYHIVGFAHFVVTEAVATGSPKYVKGRFVSGGNTVLDCSAYVDESSSVAFTGDDDDDASGDDDDDDASSGDDDDDDSSSGDDDDDDVALAPAPAGGIHFVSRASSGAPTEGRVIFVSHGDDDDDDASSGDDDDDDASGDDDDDDASGDDDDDDASGDDDDDDASGDDDDDLGTGTRYESDESAVCVSLVDQFGGGRIPDAPSAGDDDDDDDASSGDDDDDDAASSGDDDDDDASSGDDDDDDASSGDDDDASSGDDDDDDAYPGTAPNDPCPCGSGKKYRNCHGR